MISFRLKCRLLHYLLRPSFHIIVGFTLAFIVMNFFVIHVLDTAFSEPSLKGVLDACQLVIKKP